MTPWSLRRRELLSRIGAGAALLPLLRAGRAHAQEGTFPKRLIVALFPNGYPPGHFEPTGTGNNLSDLKLSSTLSALEPWKPYLNFLAPLTCPNVVGAEDFHRAYSMLMTGLPPVDASQRGSQSVWSPTGPTIDQVIGSVISERTKRPLRTLPLALPFGGGTGVDSKTEAIRAFWIGRNQPVTPETDPYKLVSSLFAGKPPDDPILLRTRAERKSMLDFLGRDLERFAQQLGTEDRLNIAGHLQGVRDIEKQLLAQGLDSAQPSTPLAVPTVPMGLDHRSMKHYPALLNAHFDILVSALRADVTRVATVQLGSAWGDSMDFPWLSGVSGTWHGNAHGDAGKKQIIDTWFAGQFAALLKRLASVPEVGAHSKTMLDNTVVVWATTMLDGGHRDRLPWILAGSCGGYFKTGQFLRQAKDMPVNRVLVDIANAMDVPMTSFGDKTIQGGIAGLKA